jgi:hypothetical protein
MIFHHLVDAEEEHRSPWKGDLIRDAAFDRIARFRRRSLNIRAAQHFDHFSNGALGRAHLRSGKVGRKEDLLLAVQRAGIMDEGEA